MKKILAICIIALLIVVGLTGCNGKEEDSVLPAQTISVGSAAELAAVKDYVGAKYANVTIELTDDIDLSNIDVWQPIGSDADHAFCGVFDGKGKTISGLKVVGINDEGAPEFVAKDKGIENVSSFASYGLFGYVKDATIKDVKVTGAEMDYYVDHSGYSYVGVLAGINLGESHFEDITVDGNVLISNLFHKYKTYDNRGNEQNVADECTATIFFGGAVAYSNGNSSFKNVVSHVDFDNYRYSAYYRDMSSVLVSDLAEGEDLEPEYIVTYQSYDVHMKPRQVIAGGVIGQLKGGELKDSSYDGTININSIDSYAAGLVGAVYSSTIKDSSVVGAGLYTKVQYKNASGGIAALVDGTTVTDCAVNNVIINAQKLDPNVMTMTEGGIFGYGTNLAKITDSTVNNVTIYAALIESEVGGVGGVIKDSSVMDCLSTGAKYFCEYATKAEHFKTFATVVSSVYANSVLKDCAGTATYHLGADDTAIDRAYAIVGESVYPNDRGEPAIRLYKKGSNAAYLAVDGKIDNNTLVIKIYNEELTLLTTARYTRSEGFAAANNVAETYVDYFFGTEGFRDDDNGEVTVEGRNSSEYEFRSGRSTINNVVVGTAIIK